MSLLPKKIRTKVSKWYLDFSRHYPRSTKRSLRSLHSTAKRIRRRARTNHRRTLPPAGCDLEFLFFRFVELIPVEDFNRFETGLRKLFPKITEHKDTENIFSTFDRESAALDQALWQDIGTIRRDKDWRHSAFGNFGRIRDLPEGVDHISVEMIHYLPSLVIVTFDAILDAETSSMLRSLQAQRFEAEITLRSLLPWSVYRGYSNFDAGRVQRREISKFFLDFRLKAERCIRPYVQGLFLGTGDTNRPSLPALEVFAFKGFDEAGIKKWDYDDWGWLNSLGFSSSDTRYSNDHFVYFPQQRPASDSLDGAERVGILWDNFLKSLGDDDNTPTAELVRLRGIEESREAMRALTLKISLEGLLRLIQHEIEHLRRFILADAGRLKKFLKQMNLYERVLRASALRDRFDLEFKQQDDLVVAEMDFLSSLVYQRGKLDPKENLLAHTTNHIEFRTTLLKDHLTQIRGTFSELVNLRDVRTNFKLQRRLWWLAIVATVATIISAIAGWPAIKEFLQDVSNIRFDKPTADTAEPSVNNANANQP